LSTTYNAPNRTRFASSLAQDPRKALWLARVGEENTTIAEWDIERAVQARYRADIETLQRFFSDGARQRIDVIQQVDGLRCPCAW